MRALRESKGKGPHLGQIVRIAVISPWAFIGFENIAHFSEEYTFPVKKIRGILLWSVAVSTMLFSTAPADQAGLVL